MREAGDICYADVFHDGTGVVEFVRYEDMKYAVKKLDDTKFKSHEVCIHFLLLSTWAEISLADGTLSQKMLPDYVIESVLFCYFIILVVWRCFQKVCDCV